MECLVQLMGVIKEKPQIHSFPDGRECSTLRMCTWKNVKDKDGEWSKKFTWHTVKIYKEHLLKKSSLLVEGSRLKVNGEINYRKWTDNSGIERYSTEILCDKLYLLDKKEEKTLDFANGFQQQPGEIDDEVPF